MERIFSVAALCAALCGCTVAEQAGGGLHFEGVFSDGDGTRVEISADEAAGRSRLRWQESDCIGIFSDAGHANVPYRCENVSSKAEFRPVGSAIDGGDRFWAYYPYTAQGEECNAGAFSCGVPACQSFIDGDNADKLLLRATAGRSEGDAVLLEFENVFSVLELKLKGDAVLSSLHIVSDAALAGNTVLDLDNGDMRDMTETSDTLHLKFGDGGLALGSEAVGVPLGVLPFSTSGPVTITFEDTDGGRFVKSIWPQGMTVPAGTHVVQPLAYIKASDFTVADVWDDDFSDVQLPENDQFGELVSGGYVYSTEGPFGWNSGQLRVGTKTKLAYMTLSQLLEQCDTADLTVELSVRSIASGGCIVDFSIAGSGTLSAQTAMITSSQEYLPLVVAIYGADATTKLRFGGAGFYIDSLKIVRSGRQ